MARPHDLLRLHSAAADVLPSDSPGWVRDALRRTPWVVVRRAEASNGFVPVGIRGANRSQRFAWRVLPDWVRQTVTPEELRLVDIPSRPNVPAMRTLAAVRAMLRDSDIGWGPAGSVGFELATGIATATRVSDLDLVIRAPADPARLTALHHSMSGLNTRVDCQVETRSGAIALAELISGGAQILLRTATGPRLVSRSVAVP